MRLCLDTLEVLSGITTGVVFEGVGVCDLVGGRGGETLRRRLLVGDALRETSLLREGWVGGGGNNDRRSVMTED